MLQSQIHYTQIAFHVHVRMYSFGGRLDEYPHPEADWPGFRDLIDRLNAGTAKVFSPVECAESKHWIDLDRVRPNGSAASGHRTVRSNKNSKFCNIM